MKIGEFQTDTNNAVLSMIEGTNQVKNGMDIVEEEGKAFDDTPTLVKKIIDGIQEA